MYTVPPTVNAGPDTRRSTVVLPIVSELAVGMMIVMVTTLVVTPAGDPVPLGVAEKDSVLADPDDAIDCDENGIGTGFCVW